MKTCFFPLITLCIIYNLLTLKADAQSQIPLHQEVYDSWNNLQGSQISSDGQWVSFELNPQLGDGKLILFNNANQTTDTIYRGTESVFSADNSFIAFRIKPPYQVVRKAKLDGKKKDELPKDSLGIMAFNNKLFRFAGLKSFNLPDFSGNCMAALIETPRPPVVKDTLTADSTVSITENKSLKSDKKPIDKTKKKDKTETYSLKLVYPTDSLIYSWDKVTSFILSDNGRALAFASYNNDSVARSTIYIFNTQTQKEEKIFDNPGYIRNLAFDTAGAQLAFLYSSDTITAKRYKLNYYHQQRLLTVADTNSPDLHQGYCPGENGKVYFSQDGSSLYFGAAPTPRPEPKDTLTDDEKAKVDIWNWQDPLLQPQQLKQLENEKKRTYLAVFHPKTGKTLQLADDLIKKTSTGYKGNGRYLLGFHEESYQIESSWKDANYRDVYLIDSETGDRELLLQKHDGPVSLSTSQKYLAWYNKNDSLWYTMNLKNRRPVKHTAGDSIAFYDSMHDVPSVPGPEGYAGWTSNDRHFVVYDKFDLWALDPEGKKPAVSLTMQEGRKQNTVFRYINLEPDLEPVGLANGDIFLSSFNKTNKNAGFYLISNHQTGKPIRLAEGPYKYTSPQKAKNCDTIIYTRGNFSEYPNLWRSSLSLQSSVKISDANPQQKNYLWGSVELVNWLMPDGKRAEGLLYKPANFDAQKKYPMLVYFYERYADQLHQHYVPKPSRSIISPTYCSSNGYLVFIPDISYRDGYPGQSAYDAIMSGTEAMIAKGFVDQQHMGIQGQSWGGYQTAWMVTRTNLFKAAMAGAPVSNMTSAYGGIRWGSGMVRQFQYEEGQSRIGATLWERPDLYLENSPLFKADKVETPLLIMSNDGDGAVPWYQGIELFTALRRLEKPAWLLNYNGDEHNLARRANMMDLDKRMMQFFDHYLKDAPAPEWMTKGVPAVDKGKVNGFALEK